MTFDLEHLVVYLPVATFLASLLATCLPPPDTASGKLYVFTYKVVNFVALNLGHATNKGT